MNLLKDFFFFSKIKLLVFGVAALLFVVLVFRQSALLGNGLLPIVGLGVVLIYIFLSIIWFIYKSLKHFIIGLIIFAIVGGGMWAYGARSVAQRSEAYAACVKSTGEAFTTSEAVTRCMVSKGYMYYR